MMKDQILVVGGYGHVGQIISKALAASYPGKVYAAGRSIEKAAAFSRSTGGRVLPMQIQMNNSIDPEQLQPFKLVVMCLDQQDDTFVRLCLSLGIHYIDLSAKDAFLSQVEGLNEMAAASGSTAVLSIGLAPGLTNLMTARAMLELDHADSVDITIMLGLGDRHGQAAIEWTIDNLAEDFEIVRDGRKTMVKSFTDGKRTDLGADIGWKKAYRFNFSDQHALMRTLHLPSVTTRLCFDSSLVTDLLAVLKSIGLTRLLRLPSTRRFAVVMFRKLRIGSDKYAAKVEVWGSKSGEAVHVECLLHGHNEAQITGKTGAAIAELLLNENCYPAGVYHSHELIQLDTLLPAIQDEFHFEVKVNNRKRMTFNGIN
ncbi:saccharopine dehydrogenase family protein [Paenibacillus gorillae]|uniref:saccharopine dehydrogenase family protein n=1 Tax=Paenibacillus gorillae TaxID=1243662 RepID=UPI0004B5FCB7|nr:saccharopine dehydrogenase NADP-binding domain-containing protein [Paenibacillus gorillae]